MKKVLIAGVFSLIISGCTLQLGGSNTPSIAGIFKSTDRGQTWLVKNTFLSAGGVGNIAGAGVVAIVPDPQDPKTFYVPTTNAGLLYSYDSADSWLQASALGTASLASVAVDAKDKCNIYAVKLNTVVKSTDCARSWSEVFIDSKSVAKNRITAVAVDSFNTKIVYAGDSQGDLFKSSDSGATWQVVNRTKNEIADIMINPKDTRIIYVATVNQGIYKTIDNGVSWADINSDLKKYSGAMEYHSMSFDATLPDAVLLVAKYGLLKSNDGGNTWQGLTLVTPPTSADILAAAISTANNQEIYYATRNTFYKTVDGGQNWITKRLPSIAVPTYLLVDPGNPNILYLGLQQPAK